MSASTSLAADEPQRRLNRHDYRTLSLGAVTPVPIVAVRSFPAAVRFSGLSLSYNVSYAIFGGLTPVVLTLWLRTNHMAPAHYAGGLAILGMLLALAPMSGNQTSGRQV
jgi:hypothetical protein